MCASREKAPKPGRYSAGQEHVTGTVARLVVKDNPEASILWVARNVLGRWLVTAQRRWDAHHAANFHSMGRLTW
jgi:hypothetical protein